MEGGKVVRLEFTYFQVAWDALCERDYVKITDGNGSTLMESSCGWMQDIQESHTYYFMPPILVSLWEFISGSACWTT